ncbi:branched-chain amino acid ABC transporter substrate-binding protein [Kineosporia sp. R_H_3]|uniref:branched-chain amino acid ABC transporter substrate-binding protein n=1 Tax=Kineosporia sp. R_H_3 TaxID=1961848 RepID=UPI000B4A717A|nr:branched-chain amino acid ABC transporter substrate-binding protein [Kineosporia sp. R_H_3]
MNRTVRVGAVIALTSLALAACGGGSSASDAGGDGKTLYIGTDLPLQGAPKDASDATNKLIQLYLDKIGSKAGAYTIKLRIYDDSTAAKGSWDDAQCAKNGAAHVAATDEIAVMGAFNSGCAKILVPILNQDPTGPMLMVSHANTNPGLTKTWEPGEPEKYAPSGKRSFGRVILSDDFQGSATAKYASEKLGVKKIYVLNDNQTYGQGVAKSLVDAAPKYGIEVVGNEAWDGKQSNYTALFNKIKATNPDMVYLSGIYDNNGGQLVKDKVSVLGDNTKVKLMAPDGFSGFPEMDKLPQGEGMYLTFAGQPTDAAVAAGGAAADLLNEYKAKYGAYPASSYALYGVAAMQVLLAAVEKSDGTRKGATDAVFSGTGITIPADTSILGDEIKIDPASGDPIGGKVSYLQLTGGTEKFLEAQTVSAS